MKIGKGHELTVEDTMEGGPAAAVLKPGDVITHVDGKALDGMQLNEAVKLIRGQEGSTVNLTIERVENGKTQTHVPELKAGDLGAVAKLKETRTNDVLADKANGIRVAEQLRRKA